MLLTNGGVSSNLDHCVLGSREVDLNGQLEVLGFSHLRQDLAKKPGSTVISNRHK